MNAPNLGKLDAMSGSRFDGAALRGEVTFGLGADPQAFPAQVVGKTGQRIWGKGKAQPKTRRPFFADLAERGHGAGHVRAPVWSSVSSASATTAFPDLAGIFSMVSSASSPVDLPQTSSKADKRRGARRWRTTE